MFLTYSLLELFSFFKIFEKKKLLCMKPNSLKCFSDTSPSQSPSLKQVSWKDVIFFENFDMYV